MPHRSLREAPLGESRQRQRWGAGGHQPRSREARPLKSKTVQPDGRRQHGVSSDQTGTFSGDVRQERAELGRFLLLNFFCGSRRWTMETDSFPQAQTSEAGGEEVHCAERRRGDEGSQDQMWLVEAAASLH